jgi:hypothetical protein
MSGVRYVLLIIFLALLTGLYLGDDREAEESPARSAGLDRAQPAPLK